MKARENVTLESIMQHGFLLFFMECATNHESKHNDKNDQGKGWGELYYK